MKFVVDDVAATPNAGGVYSILSDLYKDVLKNDHKNQWIFILAGKYFPESNNVKIIVRNDLKKSKIKKMLFETFYGSKFINSLKPDVYISLQNIATFGVKASKKLVYLHQPVPFQEQKKFSYFKKKERKLAFYQWGVGRIIKDSLSREQPIVIVQTKWMKKAVLKQTKLSEDNILVTHPRVSVNTNNGMSLKKSNLFFYPASNFLYKNHQVIEKAINLLQNDGINDFKVVFTLNSTQLPYRSKQLEYIGHIDREKVMKMYDTHVLLFPSYIESFGLPLIEGALYADIILAADTEFSRELLHNYSNVYFYQYNDAKALAVLMKKIMNKEIISDGKKLNIENNGKSLYDSIMGIINGK